MDSVDIELRDKLTGVTLMKSCRHRQESFQLIPLRKKKNWRTEERSKDLRHMIKAAYMKYNRDHKYSRLTYLKGVAIDPICIDIARLDRKEPNITNFKWEVT